MTFEEQLELTRIHRESELAFIKVRGNVIKGAVAVGGLIVLESVALLLGYNGVVLAGVIGILAGVAGFELRGRLDLGK